MKKFYFYLMLLPLSIFVASSCSNSDDDRDYVSLVTVVQGEGKLLFMRADSTLMNPTNLTITSSAGQRVLIEYEIKHTYESNTPFRYDVKVDDYELILTKDAIDLTAENEATIGNDAFWRIYSMNSGGGYLNVYLSFLYNYNPHTINLVANTINPPAVSADTVKLELRQNANGNNNGFPVEELVSFNVQKYITAAKEAGKAKLTLAVAVTMPNNAILTYYVVFNTGAVNEDQNFNTLGVYKPTPGATN